MSSLATKLFDAHLAFTAIESKVDELIVEIYGDAGWSDWTHDYYDESIEVYGVTPTMAAFERLRSVGFKRVWQHDHPENEPHRSACTCGHMGRSKP